MDIKFEMINGEITEIKKDIDIKFGSKNLLSFGGNM
jgi:hypothetical protein